MNTQCDDPRVEIARLQEQVKAADKAVELAAKMLTAWQGATDKWVTIINEQKSGYATRSEVIAMITISMSILGLILRYLPK